MTGKRNTIVAAGLAAMLVVLASPRPSGAQPLVTGVDGEVAHGSTITIGGSGFGEKDPAAPAVWDDGTGSPPLGDVYDGWLPTEAQQGAEYNMAYREVPFRGVDAPYPRIRFILGGAHATDNNEGSYAIGGNVGIGSNITSQEYFVSYYYRIDPLFDEHNNPTLGENLKEFVLCGESGEFYTDNFPPGHGYVGWCGSDVPDVSNPLPEARFGRLPITPANQELPYGCSGNNQVYHTSPLLGWVQFQWEGTYNTTYDSPQISVTSFPDHRVTYQSHYGDPLTVMEAARGDYAGYPKQGDLRFIGIGGFARVPRMNNGVNSFRYFAAVYMDGTHARLILTDTQSYEEATIAEPQIPSAWSDGSITATVNLGRLPDCAAAYLFVFDAANARSAQGFPVELSCGADDGGETEALEPTPDSTVEDAVEPRPDADAATDPSGDTPPDPGQDAGENGDGQGCGCSVAR